MTVSWSPPDKDGGSPVTGYTVEKCDTKHPGRWVSVNKSPIRETTLSVGDLHTGNEYIFRVIAHNAAGEGKPSDASVAKVAKPPYGKC